MSMQAECEALLFVAGKPLTAKKIADILNTDEKDVVKILIEIKKKYNQDETFGIQLIDNNKTYQMSSKGACAKVVEKYMKEEVVGELTRPSLETLTIIA